MESNQNPQSAMDQSQEHRQELTKLRDELKAMSRRLKNEERARRILEIERDYERGLCECKGKWCDAVKAQNERARERNAQNVRSQMAERRRHRNEETAEQSALFDKTRAFNRELSSTYRAQLDRIHHRHRTDLDRERTRYNTMEARFNQLQHDFATLKHTATVQQRENEAMKVKINMLESTKTKEELRELYRVL